MLGDDYDEEFNSLSLKVINVIIERKKYPFSVYVGHYVLTVIYGNENIEIEEI